MAEPELTIRVFRNGDTYVAEFTAITPFGTTTGGTGREWYTALEAVSDIVERIKAVAQDPNLLGSLMQHVTMRLSVKSD